jgi:hypothetical protein
MFVLPLSKPGGFLSLLLNYQCPLALLTSVGGRASMRLMLSLD